MRDKRRNCCLPGECAIRSLKEKRRPHEEAYVLRISKQFHLFPGTWNIFHHHWGTYRRTYLQRISKRSTEAMFHASAPESYSSGDGKHDEIPFHRSSYRERMINSNLGSM